MARTPSPRFRMSLSLKAGFFTIERILPFTLTFGGVEMFGVKRPSKHSGWEREC